MPQPESNNLRAAPSAGLKGSMVPPGDKSISHRALILGSLAEGRTEITGLLEGDDVLRTAAAMRALGAEVEREGKIWRVMGSSWRSPDKPLYFGNSGTGCRLVMGAVAGQGVAAAFEGDASLRSRPMARILDPLTEMGAKADSADGRLPCHLSSTDLKAIDYTLPKPSAQIKSAVLLAGLGAKGETIIREPAPCRDHTERMLKAFGAELSVEAEGKGAVIRLAGDARLKGASVAVPGDPSSAAFITAAALTTEGSDVTIRNVLINPHRIGFYETVREMGANITFENEREEGGEPVADLRVKSSNLRGVAVPAERAASMIDEYPILAVLAGSAEGETLMQGVGELRVKESDRLAATEAGLNQNGVETESGPDWLRVHGRPGDVKGGAKVAAHHDHRIAMSFLVMGLAAKNPVEVDGADMIATSFPGFVETMGALGASIM